MLIPSSPSHPIPASASSPATSSVGSDKSKDSGFWGKDGFSFGDLVDAVNPLHAIPVISGIYESATGSTPSPASKMISGALFGGVIGAVASFADSVVEGATGSTIGQKVAAAVSGTETAAAEPVPQLKLPMAPPVIIPAETASATPAIAPAQTAATLEAPLLKSAPVTQTQVAGLPEKPMSFREQIEFDKTQPSNKPDEVQRMLMKQYQETMQIDAMSLPENLPETEDKKDNSPRTLVSLDINA